MNFDGNNQAAAGVENQLLLCLVRPVLTDQVCERIKSLLRQPLDWDYLLEAANEHRVLPVFYRQLQAFSADIPEQRMAECRKRSRQISETNLGLTGKLVRLLALLHENDIPAIPYKGPALAQSAYGDIRLRQFTDLDILIHKRDLHRVKELFVANGCEPGWRQTEAQEAAVLRHYYEYPFLCNDRQILLEVHWGIAEHFFSFAFDIDRLWQRRKTIVMYGKSVQTLSPEDSLLVLCAHGSKHAWKRLGWICDVAQLVHKQDLDWDVVIENARALGLLRMLQLGLLLTRDLLGAESADGFWQRISLDPAVEALSGRIGEALFAVPTAGASTFDSALLQLRMRERMRDRFNYCFRLIFATKLLDSLFMPMGRPR